MSDFGLPVRDRIYPEVADIGDRLCRWAARVGLITTDADERRLRGAGFHEVTAMVLPDDPAEAVELYAQWITVLFHLDDEQDDDADRSADSVREVYAAITALMLGRPVLVGSPLMSAMADLWPRTTAGMSVRWRYRVVAHRTAGTLPTPEEYPVLRRETNGMFKFDVLESACGTEVPEPLVCSEAWKELCAASNDLTAWCNDIRSLAKESANAEPTNYVAVLRGAHACTEGEAISEVRRQILQRQKELDEAAAEVRDQPEDQPEELRARIGHLTDVIGHIPGGHASWLDTSARYRPPAA
ncbi:hypothetical protein E1202_21730 [Saccharopolyspora karakumensis]|uniref:Terpene synthase n=1 Tax=Saccharopolyspora karakumensis TaxID=2530386 RepID=A0A4R5BII6_9PSEU|nr:hypothetical protein [Saccharopolyspora karakumensis]TDD85193.1 hypothetical protein E1202_21730 [Saccharopolyspora karakumensis]